MSHILPPSAVGVGLRPVHQPYIFAEFPPVDVFEIISENFMIDGGPPLRNLERICDRYPVVMHGVSLGIGSSDPLDWDYLTRLKTLAERVDTPWLSDHLCWTSSGNAHLHDLLPLPYTEACADYLAQRIAIVQDFIGRPFAVENLSSYIAYEDSDMTEWEFFTRVVERADCKIMLDVNNVFVSSVNHEFEPLEYLNNIPLERVVQMHVAGHSIQDNGSLLDTHDHHVRDEVWHLYQHAWQHCAGACTILEWDENFLNFPDTMAEAEKARLYQQPFSPQPQPTGQS